VTREGGEGPSTADVEAFVYESLEIFGVEREEMVPEATLEDLSIDSIDLVELGQLLVERFGVSLETSEFRDVKTLGEAMQIITSKASRG